MKPFGDDLDQDQPRRVDSILEPGVQILRPMLGELALVLDDLGATFGGDEERLNAERTGLALIAEADARIAADVLHRTSIVTGVEEAIYLKLELTVVAHLQAGDGAALGTGGKDREIDVANILADVVKAEVSHFHSPSEVL